MQPSRAVSWCGTRRGCWYTMGGIATGTLDFERLYADPALEWAILMLEPHAESVRERLLDHIEWDSGIAESGVF